MRVSIVTISFNQREFLEKTILSVLEQDYPEIQYIVVDPGSTDGSRELIESFGDRIQKVFEPDRGAADGLNNGFAQADGTILGYLNSDDILYPGAISSAVHVLNKNPSTDVVSAHAYVIDEEDNILRKSYSMSFNLTRYAYGACIVNQPSCFFRADAFLRTNGFNPENKCNWDGELWVDMALAGAKFSLANDFWSGYRLHGDSITASGKLARAQQESHNRLFQKIYGRPKGRLYPYISQFFRLLRLVEEPRNIFERLSKGPIYGRMGSK